MLHGLSPDFQGIFHGIDLFGICLEFFFSIYCVYPVAPRPTFLIVTVQEVPLEEDVQLGRESMGSPMLTSQSDFALAQSPGGGFFSRSR